MTPSTGGRQPDCSVALYGDSILHGGYMDESKGGSRNLQELILNSTGREVVQRLKVATCGDLAPLATTLRDR